MNYHISSEAQVKKALRHVMSKHHTVSSQTRLHTLVKQALDKENQPFTVSPQRLREHAIDSGFIAVEIHSREGDPHKILHKCPVCGHQLKRVKNSTIWGGEVTIQFTCATCKYWTGKKKRIPTRYIFHYKS